MAASRRLAAIMFTDITGFTALAQADEAGALRLLQEQERLVRPLLEAHRGRFVKSMGDGLLIEFHNALDAVDCAVDLERRVHERNARAGARPIRVRVGIHLGDVQRRGTDILGDAVNIASRVQPLAEPEGVCLSAHVYDQVHNKVPYQFEKLGPRTLKGVREPIEIYRVVLPWGAVGTLAPTATPSPPRLAVLPLANISPDPKDEYFADGLTEELISVLSQIRGLRVISRTSASHYKGTDKPVAQIGAELGVGSVLEGSVRKAGDRLRISVQLIDVRTDEHRWTQTFDRELENVFAIQAEVAERTAGALKIELLKPEREAIQEAPTSNLTAYEHYLRGLQAYRRMGEEGNAGVETVRYFEAAIREDPDFSAPYSHLANCLIGTMGSTAPGRAVVPRARELVAKALEIDPSSSEAHTASGNLAFQVDLDWARAEEEFKRAVALNPSSSTARFWYAFLLDPLQRYGEAKELLRSAIELDPLWLLPKIELANLHVYTGDWESAIELCRRMEESFGAVPWTRATLAWAYAFVGRVDDALKVFGPAARTSDLHFRAFRAVFLGWLGRPEEGQALLREWERAERTEYVSPGLTAELCASVGEKEKALTLLERDLQDGDKILWNGYQDPAFDSIRDDPRFVALLRAMNLPTARSWCRPARPVRESP